MTPLDLSAIRIQVQAARALNPNVSLSSAHSVPSVAYELGRYDERIGNVEPLLALVEMQSRTLLNLEWPLQGDKPIGEFRRIRQCSCCLVTWPDWDDDGAVHAEDCDLDAALTAAGLDTQEKRDAKRRETR